MLRVTLWWLFVEMSQIFEYLQILSRIINIHMWHSPNDRHLLNHNIPQTHLFYKCRFFFLKKGYSVSLYSHVVLFFFHSVWWDSKADTHGHNLDQDWGRGRTFLLILFSKPKWPCSLSCGGKHLGPRTESSPAKPFSGQECWIQRHKSAAQWSRSKSVTHTSAFKKA